MKALYLLLLAVVIISCKDQGKMDSQAAKEETIDSMKVEIEKQKVIDSMQVEMAKVESQKEVVVVQQPSTSAPAATAKKKAWSNTAKGAVIGAGVGAATGAIISKKKGQGAIIGGLAGAGVGAGTGAIIDGSKK